MFRFLCRFSLESLIQFKNSLVTAPTSCPNKIHADMKRTKKQLKCCLYFLVGIGVKIAVCYPQAISLLLHLLDANNDSEQLKHFHL